MDSTALSPINFSLDEFNDLPIFNGEFAGIFSEEPCAEGSIKEPVDARCAGVFNNTFGAVAEEGGSSRGKAFDASCFVVDDRHARFGASSTSEGGGSSQIPLPAEKKMRLGPTGLDDSVAGLAAPSLKPAKGGGVGFKLLPSVSSGASAAPPQTTLQACSVRVLSAKAEFSGWTLDQQRRLEIAGSPKVLFNLYDEVYPGQKNEIKTFIGLVFHQYYLTKSPFRYAARRMVWAQFEEKIREVCDSKFPVFCDFLVGRGYLILCLYRNLSLYVPGKKEDFVSQINIAEKRYETTFPRFFNMLIDLFGEDLALLQPKISTSV